MSQEYMVLLVKKPKNDTLSIDDQPAKVFMRFTEPPDDDFLNRLALANPRHRVYCLMGASTWHEK